MALCPYRTETKKTLESGKFTEYTEVFAECMEHDCPAFQVFVYNYPPHAVKQCVRNGDPLTLEVIHDVRPLTEEEINKASEYVKRLFKEDGRYK